MESKKIVSGIKWASIQLAIDMAFRFSVKFILAKLLLPEQFGLIGMCAVFIAFANSLSELGMSAALIQKEKHEDATVLYPTAFTTSLVSGIVFYLILAVAVAPLASWFYGEPKLDYLIPILSLSVLLRPMGIIPIVQFSRDLDFKKMANIYNLSSFIAGVVAIMGAFWGLGVWALVINVVLAASLPIPLLWRAIDWKPKFVIDRKHFKEIFSFGIYTSGTSIISSITYNIDNLFIGKLLGAGPLGAYTLSFSLTEQIRQAISGILNKVMYPVFGQKQKDIGLLKNYFLSIVRINAILIYPVMIFLVLFAEEVIVGIFGERWQQAVQPLQILAVAMMVHLLVNSFASLLRGIGKPKVELYVMSGLTLFVLVPGMFIGIHLYGLIGAAVAILVHKVFLALVGLFVLAKYIHVSFKDIVDAIKFTFLSLVIAVAGVFLVSHFVFDHVVLKIVVFVLGYGIPIFFFERRYLEKLRGFIKKKR